jgi:hypothetical protein
VTGDAEGNIYLSTADNMSVPGQTFILLMVDPSGQIFRYSTGTATFSLMWGLFYDLNHKALYVMDEQRLVKFSEEVVTQSPSRLPTTVPSSSPSSPTSTPTIIPSVVPTHSPNALPSSRPSVVPVARPTGSPSNHPSTFPSGRPSVIPTGSPIASPSSLPSTIPSFRPSSAPTDVVTGTPSTVPTDRPSRFPTAQPSCLPSSQPSDSPTAFPSCSPTDIPSIKPSVIPTDQPSSSPTTQPSGSPSNLPTVKPSAPSFAPTLAPNANDQVMIQGNVVITGVRSNILNNASVSTIVKAIANVSTSSPQQTTITSISLLKKKGRFQVSSSINSSTLFDFSIVFECRYDMSRHPTFNSSYFAEIRARSLRNSVQDGSFQNVLQLFAVNHNATQLLDAKCDTITLSSTVVTPASSVDDTSDEKEDKLNDGEIVGIVVGGFVGSLLLFFLFIRFRKHHKKIDPII